MKRKTILSIDQVELFVVRLSDISFFLVGFLDLPPISSPEVHHHEQISSESSSVTRLIQEHLRQQTRRCPPH